MAELLTNDINDICFIDTETRSRPGLARPEWANVTTTSTVQYANSAHVLLFPYAIGDGPIRLWATSDVERPMNWADAPEDLRAFRDRAARGEGWFAAFNSGFDRNVCNRGIAHPYDELIPVDAVIDVMAQSVAANLAPSLDIAAKQCGHEGKLYDGKALIKLFCVAGGGTPDSHPEEWARFCEYADLDVDAMRTVYRATPPLPRWQWEQFWASEAINDRGLPVDVETAAAAAEVADAYLKRVNDRVAEITNGDLYSVKQHVAIAQWVYDRLHDLPEAQAILVKRYDEDAEDGELYPAKIGLDRNRLSRLMAALERADEGQGLTDDEADVLDLLEEREYGASATPGKFAKIVAAATPEGRLPSQYVFNGANQTGRYSSRGVQMHNLTNKTVGDLDTEGDLLDQLAAGDMTLEDLEGRFGNPGRALSRIVRPMILAPEGKVMMWGDWSNIEARILPWLADSPGAEQLLDTFRGNDKDPDLPDIYCLEAAKIEGGDAQSIYDGHREKDPDCKQSRQKGKVAILSLGFGGSVGALLAMAANYGMSFTESEARTIVDSWREGNAWARAFWDKLWEAFQNALQNPGAVFWAGRVCYICHEVLGGKTVFCVLPDGRMLTYRDVRYERRQVEDPKTGEKHERWQYTFANSYGRKGLWYGILAENVTQATAASLLREKLTLLERSPTLIPDLSLAGHTHDEIVGEVPEDEATVKAAGERFERILTANPTWLDGCPLAAEITTHTWYTKTID